MLPDIIGEIIQGGPPIRLTSAGHMIRHARRLFLIITLSGCCFVGPSDNTILPAEVTKLEETLSSPVRGTIIIGHGLNQRPSSMDFLASFFRSHGYHTLRLTLTGHDTPTGEPFAASTWTNEISIAFQTMRARYPSLPTLYLGYSMSGLAAVQALESDPAFSPSRMVLIAPALSLRTIIESARILRWLPATTISVRNLAPQAYRRYPRTPLFWYQNVAEMYDATRTVKNPDRLRSVPTLVFANPRDELVSLEGLQSWITDNQLSDSWKMCVIRPQTADPRLAEHLLIDTRALGADAWRAMEQEILTFIRP